MNLAANRTLASLALVLAGAIALPAVASEREVFVEQGKNSAPEQATTKLTEADALKIDGARQRPEKGEALRQRTEKGTATRLAAVNQDFWIFDARANIVFDDDRDGFFTRLELDFDADTVFVEADVFAVIYVSLDGGPWNELTDTATFRIFGADAGDEYFVDTDLVTGYPTGSYDVLIELYDDFDGALVAEFGPNDSPELFDLPLEDQERDQVILGGPTVFVSEGGGGALGLAGLGLLAALVWSRRRPQL